MQSVFRVVCLAWVVVSSPFLFCETPAPVRTKIDLPDAPQPARTSTASDAQNPKNGNGIGVLQGAASARTTAIYAPLYARTIFPGETARRLDVREKFIYSARQMVEPINLLPALLSSGWSQYQNSDPRYGTDVDAFGQRVGAAILREDSDRLFTDAAFPALLHEDPRYYRLGESSSNVRRTEYALDQVFLSRTDDGRVIPNYSGFLGRGVAVALSFLYYPAASRSGGVALREFGTSLGGLAAFDILREFVPRDVFSHLTIFREPDSLAVPAEPGSR